MTILDSSTEPDAPAEVATPPVVDFDTAPDRYRHWTIAIEGAVATLTLGVDEEGGLVSNVKAPFSPPWPREPTTTRSASMLSAKATISSAGLPWSNLVLTSTRFSAANSAASVKSPRSCSSNSCRSAGGDNIMVIEGHR